MSNIHVLTFDGRAFTAVFHVAVPATNNASGAPWRTIAARFFGSTGLPDGDGTLGTISAAEKTQIVAGELVEVRRNIKWGPNTPTGAQLDALFTRVSNEVLGDFQATYARYGATR